jgi:hypothetical protein
LPVGYSSKLPAQLGGRTFQTEFPAGRTVWVTAFVKRTSPRSPTCLQLENESNRAGDWRHNNCSSRGNEALIRVFHEHRIKASLPRLLQGKEIWLSTTQGSSTAG